MEFLKRLSFDGNLARKGFILAGLGLIITTVISKLNPYKKEPIKPNTLKFLTHDGKLVKIDIDKLPTAKRVVNKAELLNWIKRK
jgi:hypothetical protein